MVNIEYINDSLGTEHIVITNEDGLTLSMPKATYDAQLAIQQEVIANGNNL